jgi:hypothetical protein
VLVDAGLDALEQHVEVLVELARGAAGGRGVEEGPGTGERGVDRGVAVLAWSPVLDQGLGGVPVGVAAGGQRLVDAGGAEAQSEVALPADGVGELP